MTYAIGVLSSMLEFIETKAFSRRIDELLTADEYGLLQFHLSGRPDAGRVIPTSGGLRKLRWRVEGGGKRGGVRVIYYHLSATGQLFMLYAFGKSDREDLSRDELKALRKAVDQELKQ